MLSCLQDGGKVLYEPAAQSCKQHLGAPEWAESRDIGLSLMISSLTLSTKYSFNTESILEILPNMNLLTE